ncbi:zinc finger family protein [Salix suchowensis]|nr:zinc finger family protein [Salix suchowensis]
MCRAILHQERKNQGSSCSKEVVSSEETSRLVFCELCGSRASLYCQADDAFLCQKCDRWVHGANFLARRHVRCMLCNSCQNLTQRYLIGASTEVLLPAIVSWRERRQCDSNLEKKSSGSLKTPFLFL